MNLKDGQIAIRRIALLSLLYLIPSVQAMLPVDDPDIWWRFRTGEWIVENHNVPYQDYFSAFATGKPWVEYSWPFELIVYLVHRQFGLSGLVFFVVAMALLIAFVAHQLARRFGLSLILEVALVGLALGAMKPLMSPRPWLFTIIFFTVELLIIDSARQTGKDRYLWFLPLLFIVWANFHIQFVYGLGVLGLLFIESLSGRYINWFGFKLEVSSLKAHRIALVTLLCVLATLLTPYHLLLYRQVLDYVLGESGLFDYSQELHPMFFRSPANWIVLLLTLSAAFSLGWRRTSSPFPTLLLLMGAVLAFRARRDAWVLAVIAISVVGDCVRASGYRGHFKFSKWQIACSAILCALVLYLTSHGRQISEERLQTVVERKFPVKAVEYVKSNRLSGPLFNHLDWGGFLIWSLPDHPVAMDGRINLYGEKLVQRSLNTWQGREGWRSDPDLLKANLVISDKFRPLIYLLRTDPHFKIAYEDSTAIVFVSAQ